MKITHDNDKPTASVELPLTQPLGDYDIEDVDKPTPRDVDEVLVSQGFLDLVDDARAALAALLGEHGLEVVQLTGAICKGDAVFRPGLWLVLREPGASGAMSAEARNRVATVAEALRALLNL
ncbi:MAG TPA: hypothetical protein VGA40_07700 [Candidatus Acidoferrales bacterium]